MKKVIVISLLLLMNSVGYSYQASYEQKLASKGVNIVRSSIVDTSFPAWFKPSYNEDISHWLRVLPFPGDRNQDAYIVIPRLGVVAPIMQPGPTVTYKNFNYNELLESGLALYPNRDGDLGSWGNSVIFGHSSNFTYKQGRYKTIFAVLPLLNKGDQIWLYKKQFGSFQLLKYHILHSYETHPYDRFVTKSSTRKLLTLFTCTDIGTRDNRWLIKAEQMQGDTYVPYDHTKNTSSKTLPQRVSQSIESVKNTTSSETKVKGTHSINQEILDSIFDTIQEK